MEEKKLQRIEGSNVHLYSIITDIMHNWLAILLIVVSASMFMHVYQVSNYTPVYSTKTTMVIMNYGVDNIVYKNLQSTSKTASRFSQILNSDALQQIVAQEIGLDSFQGSVTAYM